MIELHKVKMRAPVRRPAGMQTTTGDDEEISQLMASMSLRATPYNKFEASARRYRQHALALKAARCHTIFLPDYMPPTASTVVVAAKKKKKTEASHGPTCSARTLEGRQCAFRAMAGGHFCKKHITMV
jgi:hypothetical protein